MMRVSRCFTFWSRVDLNQLFLVKLTDDQRQALAQFEQAAVAISSFVQFGTITLDYHQQKLCDISLERKVRVTPARPAP